MNGLVDSSIWISVATQGGLMVDSCTDSYGQQRKSCVDRKVLNVAPGLFATSGRGFEK